MISTGFAGLDRALDGGLRAGLTVLCGPLGIGATTLLLQLLPRVPGLLFVSTEQTVDEIVAAGERIGLDLDRGSLAYERDVDEIVAMAHMCRVLVVDSLESITNSRSIAARDLCRLAEHRRIPVVVRSHVDRDSYYSIRVIHSANTVLSMVRVVEDGLIKITCEKNRHGAAGSGYLRQEQRRGYFVDVARSSEVWRFFDGVSQIFQSDLEPMRRLWMMKSMAREAWIEAGGCERCGGVGVTGDGACGGGHGAGVDPMLTLDDVSRIRLSIFSTDAGRVQRRHTMAAGGDDEDNQEVV